MLKPIGLDSCYDAGATIAFSFLNNSKNSPVLTIHHSYGTSIIAGTEKNKGQIQFQIPKLISNKAGLISLTLSDHSIIYWQGETYISPDTKSKSSIEAYCGPKHLLTGRDDFSMAIASVLDTHDNPYVDGTKIDFGTLINQKYVVDSIAVQGLVAYKRIYAPNTNGYGSIAVGYNALSHSEFRVDFYSNDPEDFNISVHRQHQYADGNQLIEFETSQLHDASANDIGNGTLVYFSIEDSKGRKTSLTTPIINGMGRFSIPAPNYPTTWRVNAEIPYYAKSNNSLSLEFKASITDIPVELNDYKLKVGPVNGFMGQWAKDGTALTITLFNSNHSIELKQTLIDGTSTVDLSQRSMPSGNYSIRVAIGNQNTELEDVICYE